MAGRTGAVFISPKRVKIPQKVAIRASSTLSFYLQYISSGKAKDGDFKPLPKVSENPLKSQYLLPSLRSLHMYKRMEKCREWIEGMGSSSSSNVTAANPRILFYGIAILGIASWLFVRALQFLKKPAKYRPGTPDLEKPASRSFKAPQRKPGGWKSTQLSRNIN